MIELTGTLGFAIGILVLFLLDRDRSARTSTALWIPVLWVFLASSRPVSSWLNARAVTDSTDRYLDGSPVDRYVFTVLIVLALAVLFDRRRQVGALLRANGPIFLFLLYCGLSIFWSDFPEVALKRWIRAVGDIAMVFVLLTDPDPPAALKRLFARTGFLIIPLSILFDLGRGFYGAEGRYYTGVTLNKNMLGVSCLILGLGSAWLFLTNVTERGARGSLPTADHSWRDRRTGVLAYLESQLCHLVGLLPHRSQPPGFHAPVFVRPQASRAPRRRGVAGLPGPLRLDTGSQRRNCDDHGKGPNLNRSHGALEHADSDGTRPVVRNGVRNVLDGVETHEALDHLYVAP